MEDRGRSGPGWWERSGKPLVRRMLAPDPDDEIDSFGEPRRRPPNLASPRKRLAAALIDLGLVVAALYWLGALGHDPHLDGSAGRAGVLAQVLVWVIVFGTPVVLEGITGQTPGKALFGTRVADLETGGAVGCRRAFHRATARAFFWCVTFLAYTDPLAQTLHDRSAGTIVVIVPPSPPPLPPDEAETEHPATFE